MGQQLLNPPSVEGWHEGVEWLDSGTLLERVNFASKYLGNPNQPCISAVISHFRKTQSPDITVNSIVEKCLNQLGYFYINEQTKQDICGSLSNNYNNPEDQLSEIATDAIRLIVSSKEFQMA